MNSLALLPNLAGPDMIIIFLIVLIMFGAKKLPELAKGLGQAVREFSKAKEDMNSELNRTGSTETPSYHQAGDHSLAGGQPAPYPPVSGPVPSPVAAHEITSAVVTPAVPAATTAATTAAATATPVPQANASTTPNA